MVIGYSVEEKECGMWMEEWVEEERLKRVGGDWEVAIMA